MHTPEQAKELWCPMVRIARREQVEPRSDWLAESSSNIEIVAGCNTDAAAGLRIPKSCRCVADQCAMWRWHPTPRMMPSTGELVMNGVGGIVDPIPAKGYCGLAPASVTL